MNSKILIVDDIPRNIQVVANILRQNNYLVSFAKDGTTALQLAHKKDFDLILLDIMMPEMDGFTVCGKLKNNEKTANVPIIFLTAKTDIESISRAFEIGGVDYISKPFNSVELLARVKTHLMQKSTENELREANEFKDKIFSIIAHDLRGPIGSYKTFVEILLQQVDYSDTKEVKHMLKILQESVSSSYTLLENLLYWANSQRGVLSFTPSPVILESLVVQCISLLSANALAKKIEVKSTINTDIHIFGDRNMLELIIRNLISNAIKYSNENGDIIVSARLLESDAEHSDKQNEPNRLVEICVADNGVGISEENLHKILDKKEHFSTYGTNYEKGTGLGIMLCREFIEKNGGTFYIESVVDKGSRFLFTVPFWQLEYPL